LTGSVRTGKEKRSLRSKKQNKRKKSSRGILSGKGEAVKRIKPGQASDISGGSHHECGEKKEKVVEGGEG